MDTRINYCIADDIYRSAAQGNRTRNYLGMSEIGNPCDRFVWLRFRQFTPLPLEDRLFLLFRFGDKVEELICDSLRKAGYKLEGAWPDVQKSFSALGGLLRGHSDGVIHLPEGPALLEIKSANKKRFQQFALGKVKATEEKYYWQAQMYMGCAGLVRALFVILNKDDSSICTEIVPFNQDEFNWQLARLGNICRLPVWPDPLDSPACAWCNYRLHCKTNEAVQTTHNCMTCSFLDVRIAGEASYHCRHPEHSLQIHHPEMICPDYAWVGVCPF